MAATQGTRRCERCGAAFVLASSRARNAIRRFCSIPCANIGQSPRRASKAADRFWPKVNKDGPIPTNRPDLGQCWVWTAALNHGYGDFFIKRDTSRARAHRWAYESLVGPIPDGLTLDHLCRNRACVNPAHLEPVPMRVNCLRGEGASALCARKTHCVHGHAFSKSNTIIEADRSRRCRICRNLNNAKQWRRRALIASLSTHRPGSEHRQL